MNTQNRTKRDLEIIQYLTTSTGKSDTGKILYPSYLDASKKFNLDPTHIFKIKKRLIGLDNNGTRSMPEVQT